MIFGRSSGAPRTGSSSSIDDTAASVGGAVLAGAGAAVAMGIAAVVGMGGATAGKPYLSTSDAGWGRRCEPS